MPENNSSKSCVFPECDRIYYGRGLCNPHYQQMMDGKKLFPIHSRQRIARSNPRIVCDECPSPTVGTPCHVFRGGKVGGYGKVRLNGKMVGVHRYIWALEHGPIPAGLVIDHICRNRACCNVDHLRLVTCQINVTENIVGAGWQIQKAKTECPRGHPYSEENTRIYRGERCCRICDREHCRRQYAKRKAAICGQWMKGRAK